MQEFHPRDIFKLALLQELSQKHHVMVEYGIESVYNKTLRRVNRCHTFEETADAIYRTAKRGLPAGGHMVFGLPGESREEMLHSAGIISKLPLTSIKFHQLQLFRHHQVSSFGGFFLGIASCDSGY